MNDSKPAVGWSGRKLAMLLLVVGLLAVAIWASATSPKSGKQTLATAPKLSVDTSAPLSTSDATTTQDLSPSDDHKNQTAPTPEPNSDADPKTRLRANLVVVSEDQPHLIPVATSLVSALNRDPINTFMLVLRSPVSKADRQFIAQLNPARTIMVGTPTPDLVAVGQPEPEGLESLSGNTPFEISVAVAKKGWRVRDHVVIASEGEPDAILLGSTLAAHQRIPFLIVDHTTTGTKLSSALTKLKATQVTACVSDIRQKPKWAKTLKLETRWLDRPAAQDEIVAVLGVDLIKNVVLTRKPDVEKADALAGWTSPYFAQAHRSALVLVDHPDGVESEKRLFAFINQHRLKPRSLTIVGDVTTIGGISVPIETPDPSQAGDFTLDVEPGMKPADGFASPLAVGRFPFMNPSENVRLFTLGLARQRLIGHRLPRMVMIANPNPDHGALPLAETVSRATAKEYKNLGVNVSEFYGTPTQEPMVREAAKAAHLILYEGHLGDQRLFEDTGFFLEGDPDAFVPDGDPNAEPPIEPEFRIQFENGNEVAPTRGPPPLNNDENATDEAHIQIQRDEERNELLRRLDGTLPHINNVPAVDPNGVDGPIDNGAFQIQPPQEGFEDPNQELAQQQLPPLELNGMPIVILQSCYSLSDWVIRRITESGGVAIVGSVTRIHSASGSSFIKAVSDNVLYHDMTLGEAVRDARNYFLCLQDLKNARGHKEQYKSMRVALSFRLWGDPELRMFPKEPTKMKRRPVDAKWAGNDKIIVQIPGVRLSSSKTGKYTLAQHPNAQAAGLIKRIEGDQPARILPIYYARLPLPENFNTDTVVRFARAKDKTSRAAWRVDEFGRFIHVVYFPQKDRSHAAYELEFFR